jgi:hypothetical protein
MVGDILRDTVGSHPSGTFVAEHTRAGVGL